MQAIVISIGDELVLGQTVDTNASFLSAKLAELGIATVYHQTLPDNRRASCEAIAAAAERAELILISGGLGPTEDDLTRQALADALKMPMVMHKASLEAMAAFFVQRHRPMPDKNKVQAMHPKGTQVIPNHCGTAPGIKAKLCNATIYVVPGVPHEMVAMFDRHIFPEIESSAGNHITIQTAKINTFGRGESSIAHLLDDLMVRHRNPTVGTTTSEGIVAVRITSTFDDAKRAQYALNQTSKEVEQRLGPIVFGHDDQTIQQSVMTLLKEQDRTVATAESCTGGLLGKMLTDVPGSSTVYAGGWVTYSNELKRSQLGVADALIIEHGAVSEQVACAMAGGAIKHSGADMALSITGVAGPEGGSIEKPVGTVWIALARPHQTEAYLFYLGGTRDQVRNRAAHMALQMLRYHLLDVSLDKLEPANRAKR